MPQPSKSGARLWSRIKRSICCFCCPSDPEEPLQPPPRPAAPTAPTSQVIRDTPLVHPEPTSQSRGTMASPSALKRNTTSSSAANGYFSPPTTPSATRFKGSNRGSMRMSSFHKPSYGAGAGGKTTIVRDTAITLKRKSASELGAGISETADKCGFLDFVEYIRSERLSTLPHKGSKWDTVLIRALYFAERLHGFESALKGHALDTDGAAQLGYGHTKLLLELGHENSEALDKAFGFLYRCSASVAALLARSEVLDFSSEIYEQLCMMYSDLLTLVIDVAVRFYKSVHSSGAQSASLDLYAVFGNTIATFRERRDAVVKTIWRDQIAGDDSDVDEAVDVSALARWLAPQDRVLATLELDHTLIADELAEFTCVWFHDDLAKFIKSSDTSLLINGPSGSGKTTLASSLAERLQRPVARKSYATAFYSVGAVPSQATTLNVVKALLHQLLAIRVGNMHMFHAIAQAYEKARFTADPAKYEDLLWVALEDVLRSPLKNGQDTVLIVEGLDEVLGGHSAGQGLLQRLVHVTTHAHGVKLVALAESLSLPTGTHGIQRSMTLEDTHDDIHEVALKTLAHSPHFRHKTGREQESIVSRLIDTSGGSFLWASLTCELLKLEKSAESFSKAVNTLLGTKTAIPDLVQRILTTLEPSEDAKLLLSFLTHAARPLTYREIECLFAMNTQTGTTDRRVDVNRIVNSLAPVLTIQEDIVRVRHLLVQNAVRDLLKQGKVAPTSIKDQSMDILLRLLTYAKVTLPEQGEPTLDSDDRSPVAHNFNHHPFLEYVIRYWTWHLQQTSVIVRGKPSELKVVPEMQKVFPQSTTMAVLEWLCWDDQFPGAQEVEFHEIVGKLRGKILGEQHPAVIQSYINTACYYEMMQDVKRSTHLYYLIATIGRKVLSVLHPVVIECSLRFLRISQSSMTTTRTEIMTYREQILILLISAYERQYGASSEIVIRTREQLAEFYVHIHEHDKAEEILIILRGDVSTGGHHHHSEELEAIGGRLGINLRKRHDRNIDITGAGIFVNEEEDDDVKTILELSQVEIILIQIQTYISEKKFFLAEQTYVELWQRLSISCRTTLSVEWHQKKIEVVQAYAQYLETHQRRSESISLHTSLWHEYEHSEVSFSETITTSLTKTARYLKTVGEYSVALAIYKHACSYYKNVRKEESHSRSFTEIEEEMTIVSEQALAHSHSSKEVTSETEQWSMFHVLISNKSKTIDSKTITMAKTLTAQYIEQRQYSQAISVVHTTLQRTWSSFMSKSVHEVTMTSTFQKESIELVEQLAHCYISERSFEKAEDVYVRLFRASLTWAKDQTLLEKSKTLIIAFYIKRGHADKVISIYQELLAVYRRILGPSHETTIAILYELAVRCRAHARSHPYWVEYYQQIITVLNGDSKTCHHKAFEAAIIVAESYWEERRYSDAVSTYAIIWSTFVHKHKEFKHFSQTIFVRDLYERYYQCLEETKSDYEMLLSVTKEYRETTRVAFGASSSISIEATVALAKVYQYSESHSEESISLYEEASSAYSKSTEKSSVHIDTSFLRQTLTKLYKRRITHSESKSVSSESISKAIEVYQEQYTECKKQYSYSHESTLTSLRELCVLYSKQKKTESIHKELSIAITEVVTKETSSQKMFQSASSIVQTYQACGMVQQCTQIIEDLHYQLITCEKSSKSSITVTKTSSSALVFLAVMLYHSRKDISLTMSEILATLKLESLLYSEFNKAIHTKAELDKVLLAAAPLRYLLLARNRTTLVSLVDTKSAQVYTTREAANIQLLNKDSARVLVVGILEHLANRKTSDFTRSVILASNKTLSKLIANNQFQNAYDVAKMSFAYAQHRNAYRQANAIARGFALASCLDGRGENRCPDPELRQKLLDLSNTIIKDILKICKELKINLAQVPLKELNELIALLGEQKDYDTLETLLNDLWNTRDAQRSWEPKVLINLGRRLICARYLAGRQIKALRLCEDIAYNLRRVHGVHDPSTIESYELLAQLYTRTGQYYQQEASTDKSAAHQASEHFKKAVYVHEDVLRWLLSDGSGNGPDDDDDDDAASTILAQHGHEHTQSTIPLEKRGELAKHHLHLLKLAYQRFGGWPKSYAPYEKLNADLFKTFGSQLKGAEGVEKWNAKGFGAGKAESNEGAFTGAKSWEILVN